MRETSHHTPESEEASLRGFDARVGGLQSGSSVEIAQSKNPDGSLNSLIQNFDADGNKVGEPYRIASVDVDSLVEQDERLGKKGKFNLMLGAKALVMGRYQDALSEPEVGRSPEEARYRQLFQPYVRPELTGPGFDYDVLFEADEDIRAEKQRQQALRDAENEPIREQQREYDQHVTEKSRADAVESLALGMRADAKIRAILGEYIGQKITVESIDEIRQNAELREKLGTYLMTKLDALVAVGPQNFGDRIVANTQKSPDGRKFLPVERLTSREYAVYLALSMLDGSFNADRVTSTDVIERNDRGFMVGQHRDAAQQILYSHL